MKRACRRTLASTLLLFSSLLPGAVAQSADSPATRIVIADPVFSDSAANTVRWLREIYPSAPLQSVTGLPDVLRDCLDRDAVCLIPAPADLPLEYASALVSYLNSGGAALFLGTAPFTHGVRRRADAFVRQQDYLEELASASVEVRPLSDISTWRQLNEKDAVEAAPMQEATSPGGWPVRRLEVAELGEWEAFVADSIAPGVVRPELNTLLFQARAITNTSQMVVMAVEDDGSHWFYRFSVATNWQLQAAAETDFAFFHGGRDRNRPGDHPEFSRLARLQVGLSMHLAPQSPQLHIAEVTAPRFAVDALTGKTPAGSPDIPLLSPAYRYYSFTGSKVVGVDGSELQLESARMSSPLPRERGRGGLQAADSRWVPLFTGVDEEGRTLGWPGSLFLSAATNAPTRRIGWIGIEPEALDRPTLEWLLAPLVYRLSTACYLLRAGCEKYAYYADEPIRATTHWSLPTALLPYFRLAAELCGPDGAPLVRDTSAVLNELPAEWSAGPIAFDLGSAPATATPTNLLVRVKIENLEGIVYDEIAQPIKVLPRPDNIPETGWVKTDGHQFIANQRPWFVCGINYWPLTTNGRAPGEYNPHWLEPAVFDPDLIRRDLDLLQHLGINALAVQYHEVTQAPQFLYFLDEAKQRGMRVVVFIGHLQPLYQDLERAKGLLEAAALAHHPEVFAIDLAWEPRLGLEAERQKLDSYWESWLLEQYGSVEHAEELLGRPLWRNDGRLTGPSDDELKQDGSHRVAVAVYRRFVDDYMSRRYGELKRFLGQAGCRQLITARTGYGGTGNAWGDPQFPLDLAAGAAHLDFLSPEGWGLDGRIDEFHEAGFITAYARGVSDGKPVVWIEFGSSVGYAPQEPDLQNQARVYLGMSELLLRTESAGSFAWWYPSGLRVDEKSDMGVVNPDGTPRPAAQVLAALAKETAYRYSRAPRWEGRTVHRDADARGISALWNRWRSTYRTETADAALIEMRPAGFGTESRNLPRVSIAGTPHRPPAPIEALNAEWGGLRYSGESLSREFGASVNVPGRKPLTLEVINTGWATWSVDEKPLAGTVWLHIQHPDIAETFLPVSPLKFGKTATLEWTPSANGSFILRMHAMGVGDFGEALLLSVGEPRADTH